MGATEVIHGVSGSTMALILGVYQEFIFSLRKIDRESLQLIRKGYLGTFWKTINGNFLISLLSGIAVSLFSLTKIISWFVQYHFIAITSFLFGLIAISGILLLRKITKWSFRPVIALLFGILINYGLTVLTPLHTHDNLFFVLICGFLAGFSLVFPGISSAFILLVIGKYQHIVVSFGTANVAVIAVFLIGCLSGLWMASRFMYRLLIDYYSITIALLAGLMLGALNKLWPWRHIAEYVTNGKGEQVPAFDQSVLPWHYVNITGSDPHVFLAVLMMAVGVFIVVLIEKIAAGLKTKI